VSFEAAWWLTLVLIGWILVLGGIWGVERERRAEKQDASAALADALECVEDELEARR